MNQITITIGEERVQVNRGTSLAELATNYASNFKYEIILAKVNGIYQELTEQLKTVLSLKMKDF